MAERDPNWTQVGPFLPLATLADSWTGPVILADETQTIRWFVATANKDPVKHIEHVRGNEEEGFLQNAKGKPVTATSLVKPAFWAMAQVLP